MLKTFTRQNTWTLKDFWWGNWYVVLPEWHKYHRVHYDNIPVEIHGWLTYSDYARLWVSIKWLKDNDWVIWFDTCHLWDNSENCNEEFVKKETENLRNQIELLSKK